MDDISETRRQLVDTAVDIANFDGWLPGILRQAEQQADLPAGTGLAIFPGGTKDIIAAWMDYTNQDMAAAYTATDTSSLKHHEKIKLMIQLRLELNGEHKEAVRRALGWFGLPQHQYLGTKNLYNTVDHMWKTIGDNSVNFNFYSKRAILAGVYASTLLCWLQEEDTSKVDAFLVQRLQNVLTIPKIKQKITHPFSILKKTSIAQGLPC